MSDNFPDVLRTHAESMASEGWHTVANALNRAAAEIEELRPWKARESETQDALQKIGEQFGVHGGEPRTSGVRRLLTELRAGNARLRSALRRCEASTPACECRAAHINQRMTTGRPTPGPWRARAIRYGSFSIEAELPCINGLRAWFTIATVHAPDDAERMMSDGLKGTAKDDAEFIALACSQRANLVV